MLNNIKNTDLNRKVKLALPKVRRSNLLFIILLIFLFGMYINSTTFVRQKLANYYLKNKKIEKAISMYKKILRKETLDKRYQTLDTQSISDVYLTLANLLLNQNKFYESAKTLKQLAMFNPTHKLDSFSNLSDPYNNQRFGFALLANGLDNLAIALFKKSAEQEPQNYLGYYLLALVYQKHGDRNNAVVGYEKAVELAESLTSKSGNNLPAYLGDAYYNLGIEFEKNSDLKRAEEYYKKAIKLDSSGVIDAYSRLISIYKQQGITDSIQELKTNMESIAPDYSVNYDFSSHLRLLGYSINEKEFELFNAGTVVFFWQIVKTEPELEYGARITLTADKAGERYYQAVYVKNLAPNFGFEMDIIGEGYPSEWDMDRYRTAASYHKIIFKEEEIAGKGQCLLLLPSLETAGTSCETRMQPIEKNAYYIYAGWVKSETKGAWMGIEYGPEYIYPFSNIVSLSGKYLAKVIKSSSNVNYFKLILSFIAKPEKGKAYFDDIFFVKLELPRG